MSAQDYARVLREASNLSPEDQLRLIRDISDRLRRRREPGKKPLRWEDFAGSAPYPLCGEDAQEWVTRTRQEADDRRKVR